MYKKIAALGLTAALAFAPLAAFAEDAAPAAAPAADAAPEATPSGKSATVIRAARFMISSCSGLRGRLEPSWSHAQTRTSCIFELNIH